MSTDTRQGVVLARRPLREHDLRVTLLLDDGCRIEVLAPSGQQSRQRYAAGLSLLVLYRCGLTTGRKGVRLDDAAVDRAWPALLSDLRWQTVAAAATGVAEELAEPVPHDAGLFLLLVELYDAVSRETDPARSGARLVRFTLEALGYGGHGLALDRCVRCDNPAPEASLVTVDPSSGGIVCRACGGGSYRLQAADRAALRAVLTGQLDAYRPGLVQIIAALTASVAPRSSEILDRAAPFFAP